MSDREEYLATIESAVGGAYEMQDGRDFWMDGPVAREVAKRAASGVGAWVRSKEPASVVALTTERDAYRDFVRKLVDSGPLDERRFPVWRQRALALLGDPDGGGEK